MLQSIKKFFENRIQSDLESQDQHSRSKRLHLATAALLIEISRADDKIDPAEQKTVLHAIQSTFNLNSEETAALISLAEEEAANATCYFEFTSLINRHFTMPEKITLMEMMWRVAFADKHLQLYEEHLIRKLADLLYVPHRVFIAAKLKIQQELLSGNSDT